MDPDAHMGRVAGVALGRLQTCGFALTTLGDVARAADLSEAQLRARFGDLEGLMGELVSPLMSRLRAVAALAASVDLHDSRRLRQVIEGYLDALVAHRTIAGVVLRDPTAGSSNSVALARAAVLAVRDELARGTGGGLDHTIRAASALDAVQAAVLELTVTDPLMVRDVITDAAVAILLSSPGMGAGG